jgi:hypothetical protein
MISRNNYEKIKEDNDNVIAEWEHTKWVTLTSFSFMIPAFVAFCHKMYDHSTILFLTSIISANYWRKATYSWRRNLDLIFAKISFIFYVYNGVKYVTTIPDMIPGYGGLILIIILYYLSGELLKIKNEGWYKCHMSFHLWMMYEQLLIINNIIKENDLICN